MGQSFSCKFQWEFELHTCFTLIECAMMTATHKGCKDGYHREILPSMNWDNLSQDGNYS